MMDSLEARKYIYNGLQQLQLGNYCNFNNLKEISIYLYFINRLKLLEIENQKENKQVFEEWISHITEENIKKHFGIKAKIAIQELGVFLYLNYTDNKYSNVITAFNYYLVLYMNGEYGPTELNAMIWPFLFYFKHKGVSELISQQLIQFLNKNKYNGSNSNNLANIFFQFQLNQNLINNRFLEEKSNLSNIDFEIILKYINERNINLVFSELEALFVLLENKKIKVNLQTKYIISSKINFLLEKIAYNDKEVDLRTKLLHLYLYERWSNLSIVIDEDSLTIPNQILRDQLFQILEIWRHFIQEKWGSKLLKSEIEKDIQLTLNLALLSYFNKTMGEYGIDPFPEAELGRGPVDFLISFKREKILLEVKRISKNTFRTQKDKVIQCIHGQIPDYCKKGNTNECFFILVTFFKPELELIRELSVEIRKSEIENNLTIQLFLVESLAGGESSSKKKREPLLKQ